MHCYRYQRHKLIMSEIPFQKLIELVSQGHVKPFLPRITGLRKSRNMTAEVKRLERIQSTLHAKLPVCFLGNAGIGKSTLINASFWQRHLHSVRRRLAR
jgi:predicted GTPase